MFYSYGIHECSSSVGAQRPFIHISLLSELDRLNVAVAINISPAVDLKDFLMVNSARQTSQSSLITLRSLSLLLCALATFLLTISGSAQTNVPSPRLTQPHTLREDFQGDSLGQWASYPPVQDIGYEPSVTPTSQYNAPGGRSLMRILKPNLPGALRFGFIKKIRIVVGNNATISFAYRINAPKTGGQIEIGLGGTNGILYTKKITAETNRWTVAAARLAVLQDANGNAPPLGLRVEALYLVVNLDEADADTTYRFMIDNLSLEAMREANFSVTTPATEAIDPWPVLVSGRSYRPGDNVALELTALARFTAVNGTLKNPEGRIATLEKLYDDGTHGDRRSGDGIWANSNIYSVSSADRTGLWRLQLDGSTEDSKTVSTVVRLMIHPAKKNVHPRLFFDAADRQKLVERSRDPKLASLWSQLQKTAKDSRASGDLAHGGAIFELLDSEYLLPSLLAYFDVLNRARTRIAHNAFEAYVTESAEARAAAKSAMLDVANWKRWQPPWFDAHGQHTYYPAGLLAADVALGYDLLYSDLTETERAQIRRALIEKSIIPTYKEYVLDNRAMANTSNWIAHTVGGALIAAASIDGDVQTSASPTEAARFEVYIHGLLLKLEDHMAASYLADGSYGEGISYHEFDSETLGPALNAIRRAFGIDYWGQTHVLDSLSYPLYTLAQPTSGSLDMGDTHPPAGHGIAPLVYESKDPVIRWYYGQFDRPSLSKFIFYDDSVAPQPPLLPTSRIFRDKGNAVFRSGWDKDAVILLYRAGPNFNHHHADQGSFLVNAFGENLVTEAGWSDYYKDPYYATFFTQAIGHSTLLVDNNPESQTIPDTRQFAALNNYPRITDAVTSEFYDGVGSELSSVYKNRLTHYRRRLVFVKPYYFVVFDDLTVKDKPAQFDVLLHLPNRDKIKIDGLTAIYNGEKASLAVRSFAPNGAKLSVENGRIPYQVLSARTPPEMIAQPAYLDFKTVKPLSAAQFLTAIVPAKNESAAQTVIKEMSEIAGENLKGIRVRRGDEVDLVMFRLGTEAQTIRHDEWSADAATLAITQRANDLEVFAVQSARLLRRGNQTLFSSESPSSVAVQFNGNQMEVACSAETTARITLFAGKQPLRVLLDGKELSASAFRFNRSDGTISLDIPSRQHELKIMFR
ncbi:MAG TPA: heparinase II/III family protein [Pyrinomonadaceae bacterium]